MAKYCPCSIVGAARGIVVRFIEYMDVGTCNGWRASEVVPSAELVARIGARWPIEPVERAYRGEVAERWRFADGAGELGFVSSVSAPFCGDCHRARLSADGKLYTCLFASVGHGPAGTIARRRHRTTNCWSCRVAPGCIAAIATASCAPNGPAQRAPRRIEMYRIGG